MQAQISEAEAAATAAHALLESTQAEAAATLITTRASLQAALETAESDLASIKVAVPTGYSDMHSKFSRNPMAELLSFGGGQGYTTHAQHTSIKFDHCSLHVL